MPLRILTDVDFKANRLVVPVFADQASFPTASSSEASIAFDNSGKGIFYSSGTSWLQIASLSGNLSGLQGLTTTGYVVRTGTSTFATRSMAISVIPDSFVTLSIGEASGVSANTTFSVNTSMSTIKLSVFVATTANITLSGLFSIDGMTLFAGDRVLVKNQTTASENGIYTVSSGAWTRSTDFDSTDKIRQGMLVYVRRGVTNGNTYWIMTSSNPTLGTTALNFERVFTGGTLPSGSSNQMLRHTGSGWEATSAITTDGTVVNTSGNLLVGGSLAAGGGTVQSGYSVYAHGGGVGAAGLMMSVGSGDGFFSGTGTAAVRLNNTTASQQWAMGVRNNGDFSLELNGVGQVLQGVSTSGILGFMRGVSFSGVVTSAILTVDEHNYSVGDDVSVIRFRPSGAINITGLAGGVDGRMLLVMNVHSGTLYLVNESSLSTAENRFSIGSTTAILQNRGVVLIYDGTSSRWRLLGGISGTNFAENTHTYLVLSATTQLPNSREFNAGTNVELNDGGSGGSLTVSVGTNTFALTGALTPSSITGTVNNWNPMGSTGSVLRVSLSGDAVVTGLQGGTAGRIIQMYNVNTDDFKLTLRNESGSSTAGNRFSFGRDLVLSAGSGVVLWYDTTSSRWRAMGAYDNLAKRLNMVSVSSSRTLAIEDAERTLMVGATGDLVITVPGDSSVNFWIGTVITIVRVNTGKVSVSPGTGVTLNSVEGDRFLRAQYSSATLVKTAANTWLLSGDLSNA